MPFEMESKRAEQEGTDLCRVSRYGPSDVGCRAPSHLQVGKWVACGRVSFWRPLSCTIVGSVLGLPTEAALKQMPFQLGGP